MYRRRLLAAPLLASLGLALLGAAPADALRNRLVATYAGISSYKITVLGTVRSSGVYVAPDKYAVATVLDGKPVKTVIIGSNFWIFNNGKWERSDLPADNLKFDIVQLLRVMKRGGGTLEQLPAVSANGRKTGAFAFTFKSDGSREICNYEPTTYRVVRCKTNQLTVLYSGFNLPSNTVSAPK